MRRSVATDTALGGFRRMVQNLLFRRIPVQLLALTVCAGGHNHSHGVGEPMLDSRVRLSPAAQAFDPVRHMREVVVADEGRGDGGAPALRAASLGDVEQGVVLALA